MAEFAPTAAGALETMPRSYACLLCANNKKPLPADYTGRKRTHRPSSFWRETDLENKEPTLLELLEALAQPGCPFAF